MSAVPESLFVQTPISVENREINWLLFGISRFHQGQGVEPRVFP